MDHSHLHSRFYVREDLSLLPANVYRINHVFLVHWIFLSCVPAQTTSFQRYYFYSFFNVGFSRDCFMRCGLFFSLGAHPVWKKWTRWVFFSLVFLWSNEPFIGFEDLCADVKYTLLHNYITSYTIRKMRSRKIPFHYYYFSSRSISIHHCDYYY